MHDYGFFIAHLRFIVAKTEVTTPEVGAMMAELSRIADSIESTGGFSVAADDARIAGRGLAGLAGFLQERILPETVAAGNTAGEGQIRWVIDTAMALVGTLMTHAETQLSDEPIALNLPPPPAGA